MQPAGVKTVGKDQHEQLGGIHRLRRAGQQLVAQALGHFTGHGGARCKAKVGQQGGDVNRLQQLLPPLTKALAGFGVCLEGGDDFLYAPHGQIGRRLGCSDPFHQMDKPQVALRQIGMRIQRLQQARKV